MKRIEWKARIDAWKVSNLSATAWCRELGIKTSKCIIEFEALRMINHLI